MNKTDFPNPKFIPLEFEHLDFELQRRRAESFYELMKRRRTVRDFSDQPIPFELIETAIAAAGTAPSGANMQPWRFVVVRNPEIKRQIRQAAEEEERQSYHGRMPERWLGRLAPLGTDWQKPFSRLHPI